MTPIEIRARELADNFEGDDWFGIAKYCLRKEIERAIKEIGFLSSGKLKENPEVLKWVDDILVTRLCELSVQLKELE